MQAVQDRAKDVAVAKRSPRWSVAVLGAVLLVALLVRLPGLNDPPSPFHTVRQYYTAIHAKALVDQWTDAPTGERRAAQAGARDVYELEAPIQSLAVAAGWTILGTSTWWWARLFSILGYLIGGVALADLLRRRSSLRVACIAVAIYCLNPFAIELSTSLQPDAFMIGFSCVSIAIGDRLLVERSRRLAVMFTLTAVLAILVKGAALFVIGPALLGIIISDSDARANWRDPRIVLSALATLLIAALYYVPAYTVGDLRNQGASSIAPDLLANLTFWTDLARMLREVVGFVGVLAIPLAIWRSRSAMRGLLIGLSVGYIAFAFLYDYRSATHNYYAAILIPTASIAIAVALESPLRLQATRSMLRFEVAAFMVALSLAAVETSYSRYAPSNATPPVVARQIGDQVAHSTNVVMFAPDYGYPLRYYGSIAGPEWPYRADLALERLLGQYVPTAKEQLDTMRRDGARYFVAMGIDLESASPGLNELLRRFAVIGSGRDYVVYDLRAGSTGGAP